MAIPEHIIDQIRNGTDIVEVISSYVPLKKTGRSYKAPCPFHNEKTPSFVVSPDKQIYHCFGCGAGGNVFSFLMKHENLEFPEAVEMLAQKAGIPLPHESASSRAASSLANQLYKVEELACAYFEACLAKDRAAQEYLSGRGVGPETARSLKIGLAPGGWQGLAAHLVKQGVSGELAEKAGLVIAGEKGGYYDRFRNRITFPIIDMRNRILGFGARVMDASLPKYINSPETPIYSKGRNLYGLNLSKDAIKKAGSALIVEGYLDFIVPYQAGVRNIIATLGTALTVDQVKLLKRFTETVVMVYDPDAAGEAASIRNLDLFLTEDMNVYVAELTGGLDPDSFIRKSGAEEFLALIKRSRNIFDYKFEKLAQRIDTRTLHGKTRLVAEMLPTISKINNAVFRSGLVRRLSEKLSVDEDAIKTELKKLKPSGGGEPPPMAPADVKRDAGNAEKVILALLLDGGSAVDRIIAHLAIDEFRDSSIRDIASVIYGMRKEQIEVNPAWLISRMGNNTAAAVLVSEAVSVLEMLLDKEKALEDCIARIKKDNLKDRLSRIQEAIRQAHSQHDEEKVRRLVTEYNGLVKADAQDKQRIST